MTSRLLRDAMLAAWTAGFGLALPAAAQDLAPAATTSSPAQFGDWLKSDSPTGLTPGESAKAKTDPTPPDPFAVLTSGALWRENHGGLYTRDLGDALSLHCEATEIAFDQDDAAAARAEKFGLLFAPAPEFHLTSDVQEAETDGGLSQNSTTSTAAEVAAESHLPTQSVVHLGLDFQRTVNDAPNPAGTQSCSCTAQLEQPLGKLPLTASLKGAWTAQPTGSPLPSLEQALVWKPAKDATVQMGLRQQQYQEYPGVTDALNEAIFADWSQRIVDDVSWHSYAELLNTRGLVDQAPVSALASGANGTPQANNPAANASLTSSVPLTLDQQTLTFSTGPSFKLQKDISASVEYSNRWDKTPGVGAPGTEQRVSVSVKGSF